MEYKRVCCFLLLLVVCITAQPGPPRQRRGGTADDSEQWGYTTVREGAHMFWWLYRTTHTQGHASRPLLIWIQGGPGLSGTGLGNFAEIGPLDTELNQREATWLQEASLLFFDSPVGTGFSYVEDDSLIPNNIYGIADDLLAALLEILQENPEFMEVPVYIFGQSYGGKMGPAFARRIQDAIGGELPRFDLRAVCLGNGFTSPADTIINYAPLVYNLGLADREDMVAIQREAKALYSMIFKNDTLKAFDQSNVLFGVAGERIPGLNLYDYADFYPTQPAAQQFSEGGAGQSGGSRFLNVRYSIYDLDLDGLMNGPVRDKLQIIPQDGGWDGVANAAYFAQSSDLMRSALHLIDELLNSGVHVVVYQGNRDIICNTPGALSWMRKLRWPEIRAFHRAPRQIEVDPETGRLDMFTKDHQLLHMYWIPDAGHAVPDDNPGTALRMLRRIFETTEQQ